MEGIGKRKNRVTIKDVAKAANVSIATVSYVLNNTPGQSIGEETRKKVLQFANILGYECDIMARYLATGKTGAVAAVVGEFAPLSSQYYMKLLTELSRLLFRQSVELKLVDYSDALGRSLSTCDAYITVARTESEFRAFADTKYVPVLAIDSEFDDYLFYRINDDYKAMYASAKSEIDGKINLLTFRLPEPCLASARAAFDGVTVVENLSDLASLDIHTGYATVSKLIFDNVPPSTSVKHISASFALKASAAADAVIKAVNRVRSSDEDHNIKV